MKELWTEEVGGFDGEHVQLTPSLASGRSRSRQPHPPVLIGGAGGPKMFQAVADYADGWMPIGGRGLTENLPKVRAAFEEAGRDPATLRISVFGAQADPGRLGHYEELGCRAGRAVPAARRPRRRAADPRPVRRAAGVMRSGVCIPQSGRYLDPEVQRRLATEIEAMGFDSIWTSDHVIVPAGESYIPEAMHEPLALLAWLAASTSRVTLGVSVLVIPYRDPVFTAKLLSSVDVLSGGRVVLGAGVGWLKQEFDALVGVRTTSVAR